MSPALRVASGVEPVDKFGPVAVQIRVEHERYLRGVGQVRQTLRTEIHQSVASNRHDRLRAGGRSARQCPNTSAS
jgi:hypothetical protein